MPRIICSKCSRQLTTKNNYKCNYCDEIFCARDIYFHKKKSYCLNCVEKIIDTMVQESLLKKDKKYKKK